MWLAQGPQLSDASEAQTCGLSVSGQALHHRATARYDKCSKLLKTFLFLFSRELLVFMAGIHKMVVRLENREDLDQTASEEAV